MSGEVRPPETSAGRSRISPQAILILVGLTVVALFGLSAFLPRWWSHRIGDQVHGSFSSGIGLGLFYGFVFTLIPLAIAWVALGRMSNWKGRLIALGLVVLVAGRICSPSPSRSGSGMQRTLASALWMSRLRDPDQQPHRRHRRRARDRDACSRPSLPPSVARGGGGTEGPAGGPQARWMIRCEDRSTLIE